MSDYSVPTHLLVPPFLSDDEARKCVRVQEPASRSEPYGGDGEPAHADGLVTPDAAGRSEPPHVTPTDLPRIDITR